MKAAIAVLATCILLALGFFIVRGRSASDLTPVSVQGASETPTAVRVARSESGRPQDPKKERPSTVPAKDSSLTTDRFEHLSPDEQNKAIESFVSLFWKQESSGVQGSDLQEENQLSLDIFTRPYMRTVSESDLAQLSQEDREKVMAETFDSCRQSRDYVKDVIARAQSSPADSDPVRVEAYLISALETGRDLSANKSGMLITRLTGLSCQASVLKEMVNLYTRTDDRAKWETAQQQLRTIQTEAEEMRAAARQAGQ